MLKYVSYDVKLFYLLLPPLKVLDLLYLLVKYGYYASLIDINELISHLMSLLNGVTDKPYSDAGNEQSVSYREVRKWLHAL